MSVLWWLKPPTVSSRIWLIEPLIGIAWCRVYRMYINAPFSSGVRAAVVDGWFDNWHIRYRRARLHFQLYLIVSSAWTWWGKHCRQMYQMSFEACRHPLVSLQHFVWLLVLSAVVVVGHLCLPKPSTSRNVWFYRQVLWTEVYKQFTVWIDVVSFW